ncbi:MAG: hypothetical protein QJR12_09675 [Mycobacterium sp.]|uniref:hypothetical protein n=1 Tax=Mycobacterium sp. TaxID=1785 RepID=UPI0026048AE1|nr:hypothetical protein [Mycobacterium sp.]MDI3314525.1 hypothetical protein [Mycobacterium sp.]
MSTAREKLCEEILLDGLVGPVNLAGIHSEVKQQYPSASEQELLDETLESIRCLVSDALMEVGYLGDNSQFVPESHDQWMREMYDAYVIHHQHRPGWAFSFWLNLTAKGRKAALSTERGKKIARHEEERRAAIRGG